MSPALMPPGTRAAILRAVLAEKHPKMMLGAIASRFGVTYPDLRLIIDQAGYPDVDKMHAAAAQLALQEHASHVAAEAIEHLEATGDIGGKDLPAEAPDGDAIEQLVNVRLVDLHVDPDNLRQLPHIEAPDIIELADSIVEIGLLQPIVARRETETIDGQVHVRLVVVAGHRRLIALRRLKHTSTKVIVRGPMLGGDVIAAMLIENGQRRDLNPIEEARGMRRLKTEHELSDMELARRIGRSQPVVSSRLALLHLSAADQQAILNGDMSLVEGTAKGRLNSGKVYTTGQNKNWHLGPLHELSAAVKARCQRLQHPKGRRVGGMGCGECWESVIRADARQDFVDLGHRTGTCPVCEHPVERKAATA